MIDMPARPPAAGIFPTERLTVVLCPTKNPKTGRRCAYVLVEAWTSDVCVQRRRCKQCGVWYRVRLTSDGAASAFPEGARVLD
jgi:hypothetical protein